MEETYPELFNSHIICNIYVVTCHIDVGKSKLGLHWGEEANFAHSHLNGDIHIPQKMEPINRNPYRRFHSLSSKTYWDLRINFGIRKLVNTSISKGTNYHLSYSVFLTLWILDYLSSRHFSRYGLYGTIHTSHSYFTIVHIHSSSRSKLGLVELFIDSDITNMQA